jgi:hypothetical protein
MEILNKITVKGVCGELENKLGDLKEMAVMKVIGIVKDKEEVKGQYGTSFRLKGEFKAINLSNKQEYFSANCFLPGLAEDLVIGQMDPQGDNAVQFAFVIGIKAAKNKVGYEFSVMPLIKPAENNALMLIEKQMEDFNAQEIK